MANQNITLVSDLVVGNNDYVLKVKIIRLWRLPDKRNPNEYWAIEMIMLDEQGNQIQANVFKRCFHKFENYLKEDACLLIHKPSLGLNPAKFKFVDKPNKINLVYATKISTCTDFLGPRYGFGFASFANITNNQYPEELTIDVIGHIIRFCKSHTSKLKDYEPKNRRTFEISNLEGKSVFMTLWDDYAN